MLLAHKNYCVAFARADLTQDVSDGYANFEEEMCPKQTEGHVPTQMEGNVPTQVEMGKSNLAMKKMTNQR